MSEQLTPNERQLLKDKLMRISGRMENATLPPVESFPARTSVDNIIGELCKINKRLCEVIVRITLSNNDVVVLQNRCIASCRADRYMGSFLTVNEDLVHITSQEEHGSDEVVFPLSRIILIKVEEQFINVLQMVNTSKPEENDNFRKRVADAKIRRKAYERINSGGFLK